MALVIVFPGKDLEAQRYNVSIVCHFATTGFHAWIFNLMIGRRSNVLKVTQFVAEERLTCRRVRHSAQNRTQQYLVVRNLCYKSLRVSETEHN